MSEKAAPLRFCVTHRGRETDRITTKKIWTFLGDKFNFFAIWRSSLKIVMNTFRNRRIDLLLASNKSVIVLCHSLLPIFELLIDVFDVGEKIEENVMCEPARKLIRLTSLTEFTMSKGKAYNRASLYRPYIFVWDEIDTRRSPVWKDRTFGMASLFHNVFFSSSAVCFVYLSALRASDWCAKAAAYPPGFCLEPGPTIRRNCLPGIPSHSRQYIFLMLFWVWKGTEL